MLKDFLLRDDLSSCSSSGFKSFHIITPSTTKRLLFRSRSKPGAATISALQRASEVVLNAVKLLPFLPSTDKEDHQGEIRRCKLFREFLEEKNEPSDQNTTTNVSTTDTSSYSSTTITASRVSSNTSNLEQYSERSSQNDIVEAETSLPQKEEVSNTVGEDSINFTKDQDWPNEEGKEQFSPVSKKIIASPFQDGLPHGRNKSMPKVRRFESLAQLEPVDLEKRIAMAELEDEFITPPLTKFPSEIFKFRADNLLLDFFWETFIVEDKGERHDMGCMKAEKAYLKDMERNENWRNFNEEKEDVGSALELELFSSLVDEVLTDLF
ncbi:hypothetical protein V6Z11_A08G206900 [Gossypium hirsutum]